MTGRKLIDLTGMRFERLLVLERAPNSDRFGHSRWCCRCDCGNSTISRGDSLRGGVRSCGCLRGLPVKPSRLQHGHARKDGSSATYRSWLAMLRRCNNPNWRYYHRYGGRGIKICDRWRFGENMNRVIFAGRHALSKTPTSADAVLSLPTGLVG